MEGRNGRKEGEEREIKTVGRVPVIVSHPQPSAHPQAVQ